ncbi:hypothetical protein N185_32255 [Sinorhizobium sp. GW3]|nr:hypothetical protein N185_32255 [Sinorhizobium sp. GW3]
MSQIKTCFLLNYLYDVPAGSLEPDIVAQPTFADYLAGQDRVMAIVLEALATGRPSG